MENTADIRRIPLSEVADRIEVEPGYFVTVEKGDYLTLRIPTFYGTPASRVQHPSIVSRVNRLLEFKRYLPNGGKQWYSRAGTEITVVVPKSAVQLVLKPGYSWVPVVINGVETVLNVSGGTCGGGWSDWVRNECEIRAGHGAREVLKIASVAIPAAESAVASTCADAGEQVALNRLIAQKDRAALLKGGDPVMLAEGYSYCGSRGPFRFVRRARSSFILVHNGTHIKVTRAKIDWQWEQPAGAAAGSEPVTA